MRKEPILAILIGSLVGLGVAFFVWQSTKPSSKLIKNNIVQENNNLNQKNIKTSKADGSLSIVSPTQMSVSQKVDTSISGIANPNSIIAIADSDDIKILKAAGDGTFESEVASIGGLNNVRVWSFDNELFDEEDVNFVYTDQVENEEKDLLMAYSGTVTDISENTIQIKTLDDIIEQVSVSDETSYANIISDPEEIEFSEVAIGDFLLAIGTNSTKKLLEAKRVLVTELPSKNSTTAVFGSIVELSNSEFIVAHADGTEYSIDATNKVEVTKFDENGEFVRAKLSEATAGEKIIIIGETGEELIAKRIHLFPQN